MDKWCTEIVLAHIVLYQLSYAHLHPYVYSRTRTGNPALYRR